MAGYPVVFVDAGGLPVTYGSDGNGWPIEEALSGLPVTIVAAGGLPVVEGVGAAPYLGLVATRTQNPVVSSTTNKQLNSRSIHIARDAITAMSILAGNFYIPNSGSRAETGIGGSITIKMGIEYPIGTTAQRVTWAGGADSITIADLDTALSDMMQLATPIPNGGRFAIRTFSDSATGVVACGQSGNTIAGDEASEIAVSGLTDKSLTGSIAGANAVYRPLAILGMTRKASVVLVGDSKTLGVNETYTDLDLDIGDVARWIGPNFAYAKVVQQGDRAEYFNAGHTLRARVFPYASHLICDMGSNDIYNAADLATMIGRLQTIWSDFKAVAPEGAKAFQCTVPGRTSSTDSWATLVNQSLVLSAYNSNRLLINGALRAPVEGLDGMFEIADYCESSRDSGLWPVTGAANYATTDGIHPTNAISQVIQTALEPVALTAIRR